MPENQAGNAGNTAPAEGKADNTSTANAGNTSATASDQSAKIAELEVRLAKEAKEKEIYRSGLLAAKELGKKTKRITQDDLADPEKLEEAIEAKIQDKELETKALQDAEQSVSQAEALRKENEELRRSLEAAKVSNYAGIGSGHNENSESKPTGYWSDGQRNELRQIYQSRNMYSPDQIDKMISKAEEIARTKTATSPRNNDLTKTRSY